MHDAAAALCTSPRTRHNYSSAEDLYKSGQQKAFDAANVHA